MKAAILVLALVAIVQADIYLHNPRGSNNRLDEANRERNNANRMFDSQNNNRGGYNVGSVYYYAGSILPIEWTNQHTCGDQNNHCEQIIQYMCDDRLRDGATTRTIPENPVNCDNFDCNTDLEYGMNEDYDYYVNCRLRSRNMGLYVADRNLRGNDARYTRQNNNGNRRGYECPEERDYYPYWHPTPWRDVAILTTDVTRCPYYQAESANVKSRFACILPPAYINDRRNRRNGYAIPITQEDCEDIVHDDGTENGTRGIWQEFPPLAGLQPPECVEAHFSRDNHLGNTVGGFPIYYNWTVPNMPHEHCVLRIRYNITTLDYAAWDGVSGENESINTQVYNGQNGLQRRRISDISSVRDMFNMDDMEARERGYVFRQNPVVKIFPDSTTANANNFGLQLAINTNQFGRTFQDRSHSFAIRSRVNLTEDCENIYNLNVRGKRGNIVQVYPGVEYDFVPNRLVAAIGDCVHFQWTGSNTNPNNNDGQGRAGTDRSNVVVLTPPNFPEGRNMGPEIFGHWGNNYPHHLDAVNSSFLGFSREDRQDLATLGTVQYGGEMSELDDAGTYFDLGPRKVTRRGTYYYMCTRNNNFTNRGQKGKIIVQDEALATARIGWTGGSVSARSGTQMSFQQGDLPQAIPIRVTEHTNIDEVMKDIAALSGRENVNFPGNMASRLVIQLDPQGQFHVDARPGTISLPIEGSTDANTVTIMQASPNNFYQFEPLETTIVDGMATARTANGGYFVLSTPIQYGLVVGIPVAIVVILLLAVIVVAIVVYFRVRPEKWTNTKESVQKTQMKIKRSFAKQI